jgi:hypothetical protein
MITPAFNLTATERVLPKLALDFTNATLDSRVTFTRTTGTSNPATYVNSSGYVVAATNNQPRFDYNSITLACKGLLIEEQRTNLVLRSDEFENAAWTKFGATVTANAVVAPDGMLTGDALIETTANDQHRASQAVTVAATTYTATVYAKAAGRTRFQIASFSGLIPGAEFDLATVTATPTGATSSASITPVGNGWFRCAATRTLTAGSDSFMVRLVSGSLSSYTGDGYSGIYIWGAQLEAGAFPTSYIPTEASALTRNADVATMTGTNFSDWYSAGAGGVVARVLPSTVSGTRPALRFDDATANEVITLRGNTTNPELVIVDGGSPQAQIDAGTIAANTAYNLGAAWNTDNCAAAVNGGAAVTDTTATIPTVTQARLGSDGTNYLNGHLQTLRYWPQRIINAEVQAFSK